MYTPSTYQQNSMPHRSYTPGLDFRPEMLSQSSIDGIVRGIEDDNGKIFSMKSSNKFYQPIIYSPEDIDYADQQENPGEGITDITHFPHYKA